MTYVIHRVHTSLVIWNSMYFPGYFQVKAMKSQIHLNLNPRFCLDKVNMTFDDIFFVCQRYLEKGNQKTQNVQIQFSARFWVNIQGFYHFWSKFQACSRPGKVNDKIPGFKGFPGRVGTLNISVVYPTCVLHV